MSFTRDIKTPKPGDEIAAEDIARLVYEIRRCQIIPGQGILVDVGPSGTLVSARASFSNIRWVLTQAAGIAYAVKSTSGTVVTLTPGSALCYESTLGSDNKWRADTSITAALLVYNDWTSPTSHTNAGVGGAWICVGTAPNGTTRCIGDPCT